MKRDQSLRLFTTILFIGAFMFLVGCVGSELVTHESNEELNSRGHEKSADEYGEESDSTGDDSIIDPETITVFSQSPILDDQDLPPVEERLPDVPKIANGIPEDQISVEIGQYGGVLRTVTNEVDWNPDVFIMANEALINTPGVIGEEFTPNILLDYEVSEDQTEFTFTIREGLKWSDGEQVTTEDVRFTVEDVLLNEEITSSFPVWLRDGGSREGEPLQFERIDEYQFKFTFNEPYGGLIPRISVQGWRGYTDLLKPAHYLKNYHAEYTPLEELEPLIDEKGFSEGDWVSLFEEEDIENRDLTNPNAIGFPSLYPWLISSNSDGVATFERNAYYFKIDEEGNQLPYIDQITSRLVQDMEMIGVETISGNVDFSRESTSLHRMPLYRENEESGGYRAILSNMHNTPSNFHLNMTYEDETWQEVVQDLKFRQAINYAIDRDEIIDSIYYGFAEPSELIDSTFDPEEANRLLDEMGMEIGSDGFRQAPNGEEFRLDIEIGDFSPEFIPLTELLVEFFRDIGINATMTTIDRGLWGDRREANEIAATMMWVPTPLWYMGDWGTSLWGNSWDRWRVSDGSEGEEPPEDVKEFYSLIDKIGTSSPEEALLAVDDIRANMRENLWFFVHIENVKQPLIVSNRLGNVPSETETEAFAIGINYNGEQIFFKE